jgi:hypothetical protein
MRVVVFSTFFETIYFVFPVTQNALARFNPFFHANPNKYFQKVAAASAWVAG